MSFEYGSQNLKIKNPFRWEGVLTLGRGILILPLGVLLLSAVKDEISSGGGDTAWAQLIGGVVLLLYGLWALGLGLIKLFQFYVGRGIPADLAAPDPGGAAYTPEALEAMLMRRINTTFKEPEGYLPRIVHALLPRLISMPMPIRILTQRLSEGFVCTALVLCGYGLALYSGAIGLTEMTQTATSAWLGWIVVLMILVIWVVLRPRTQDLRQEILSTSGIRGLGLVLLLALFWPLALGVLDARHGFTMPSVLATPWLILVGVLSVLTAAAGCALVVLRMSISQPLTEVSEYRDHWQESIHPMDIFRSLDMAMAKFRYLEIPNRIYRACEPILNRQGEAEKGNFQGATIQEIQPQPLDPQTPCAFRRLRWAVGVLGQILQLAAGAWFFVALWGINAVDPAALVTILGVPLICMIFGSIWVRLACVYWAEMHFTSDLVYFFADGTYAESKLSSGMSIYDSNRSENTVVRASLTPWILVTRLTTCTFAESGRASLAHPRVILEMHKNDALLTRLKDDLRHYLAHRQIVANATSEQDYRAVAELYRMNEATRARITDDPSSTPPMLPQKAPAPAHLAKPADPVARDRD